MKINEIMEDASACATSAGNMAVLSTALGQPITRSGSTLLGGKYSTSQTPNTPEHIKRYKNNAVGRFKNSIGH
jgi:hypothetical protein